LSQKDVPLLIITQEMMNPITTRQLAHYVAHKSLGCYIKPAMMMKKMTMIGLAWCQHYLVTSMFIPEEPNDQIPWCPCNYYMAICHFLQKCGGQICWSDTVVQS